MGLLANLDIRGQVFIVWGTSGLVQKRKAVLHEFGAEVCVLESLPTTSDLEHLGRSEVDGIIDGVFLVPGEADIEKCTSIVRECRRRRIPVNVTDHPELCTFTLPSTYHQEPFQLAVTTNGTGCRLANRIKRAAVAALPPNIGDICRNIGRLRTEVKDGSTAPGAEDDDAEQTIKLNKLNIGVNTPHRLRWLSQMVEYYPLDRLATVTMEDLEQSLHEPKIPKSSNSSHKGRISLVGAGPGSVGLLTTEALQHINAADYVLADKLVPEEVLGLVPRHTPVFIARKFPGNAERAQEELLEKGLAAVQAGQHVVRLKQGDPYIYGRGAEEFLFFQSHGYEPHVIAGVTSALAAPLLARIAPTHRGAADQILLCTGTGRAGALPQAPEWVPSRTTIFLMALHRIKDVADLLIQSGWDPSVACAAVERASCPDQRVVRARLSSIGAALEAVGSRPPGLLVVGRACEVMAAYPEDGWTVEEA